MTKIVPNASCARIRDASLFSRIVSADTAAGLIRDGMVVGMSGFTRSGEAKAVPLALARRAKTDAVGITLITGASLGNDLDGLLADSGVIRRRLPFQSDPRLRDRINDGTVMYLDQHLSETVEHLRSGQFPAPDVAIIEAAAITEDGGIVPTTSVGNSAGFATQAQQVIVEINAFVPSALEGMHDIYIPADRPVRDPIALRTPQDRIGDSVIRVDRDRIVAIVLSDRHDSFAALGAGDDDTRAISEHIIDFLQREVARGALPKSLRPLQAGIGTIANSVLSGLAESPFSGMTMYSEVLQDSAFDLLDAGKLDFASASSITLSATRHADVMGRLAEYRDRLVLRPQEISNHPEIVRRLGIIAINTALEFDIYGNVNSTHVMGSHMMNGIGGSGDFARNSGLSIFVTKSVAKGGNITSLVPMVSHVDHTEHDVDVIVTELGLADLRGLAPRERARVIIDNCAHPDWRDSLSDYFKRACNRGGQTPHVLEEAFKWHCAFRDTGSMVKNMAISG
ncbi:succinyl-CoA:acetate CoA-transferase [Roseovarius pacificus]|uniref:Succinyl-CoA:acetate CoA-transferase n=1 Tax=Roseovarius pacificus TaxID=337701 RepID=A0A1M7ADS7_9RHOB|nr:succinate CoA transferase [Roseovarius pacificus]GGO53576.1 acetyl-CoA hydrolase [Roseovarius pacificus]SHL40848.1 succinyl-CoA:acetate CoA-transferase [Roseovarius pacificus]